jgi:hypothetical protein
VSRAVAPAERRTGDAYHTPEPLARALVGLLPIHSKICWEPHAGGGAFVRALVDQGAHVIATDINPDAGWGASWDFLTSTQPGSIDWVVGNPPFRNHEAHIDRALRMAPNVAFLLRLAVMESAGRVDCWARWPLRRVTVLAERPSFTGGGTDSAAYGWFVFKRGHSGPAEVVPGWSWK